ncbi:MAG: alpha/beta hydrolase, partial [Acidimicrobiales bacterium]
MRSAGAWAALVALAALAGSAWPGAAASASPPTPTHPSPVAWQPCPTEAGYRCGSVPVPLSYAHPHGPTVSLAVIEKLATGPGTSRGVLLFNPGGPGESGVQILPVLAALVPPAVASRFDLVSFDERGT